MASKEAGSESDTLAMATPHSEPLTDTDDVAAARVQSNARTEIVDGKPVFKPTRDFLLAFLALCTLCLAAALDATSLSIALPIISTDLGGTALEAFWSGTSFLLSSTVLQPSLASLSNIFGRKYVIYVAIVFFAVGALVAALAQNFTVILVGRTVQGIGGGGLIALTEMVVIDLVPLAYRGQWFSLLSVMWSIGTVTGPLIGAGFAQNITWRWIFWINLPIIGLGLVFVVLFLHQAKIPGGIPQKLARFDYFGSFLFTASMTAFLFGITTGGVMYEWSSFRVLLPLLIGAFGLVGFGFWEFKFAKEPIINRGIFNNRDMLIAYVMTIFQGAILWSLLYFLILYYQGVKFMSPVTSAVAVLPETLTVAPAGMLVGIVVGVTGHYRWSLWAGWTLATLGAGLLYLLKPDTSTVAWVFLNLPVGAGSGMLFPAMAFAIQAACEPALNAQATAFYSFLRGFGQALGIAISGVIFQNVFKQKLQALPAFVSLADEYSRDATSVVGILKQMPDSPDKSDLVLAYNDSLRMIWVALLAFAGFCWLLSFGIKGYSMNQEHVTEQGLEHRTRAVEPTSAAEEGKAAGSADDNEEKPAISE